MTRVAELGVQLGEALRAGDSLGAAQILADARAKGGRRAVLGVLDVAITWTLRTAPRARPDDGQAAAAS
jgi:hypothetical protein